MGNTTLHKKWSFPLRISSVGVTKSTINCGNGKLHCLCSASHIHAKTTSTHKEVADNEKDTALKETLKLCKTNLIDSGPAKIIAIDLFFRNYWTL